MMTPAESLDAALSYAARGYLVFPVSSRTKVSPFAKGAHPFWAPSRGEEAGHKRATTDTALITRWWPGALGIAPGIVPPEGVAIIDADEKNCAGVVEYLRTAHPHLEANGLHTTRSNGAHFLGRIPDGATLPQSVDRDLGIDVRAGLKGYIVAPPATGYTVVVPFRHVDDLEPIPIELIELLTPTIDRTDATLPAAPPPTGTERLRKYVWAAIQGEHDRIAGTGEGARNDTLHRSAVRLGSLVGAGMLTEQDAYAALMAGVQASPQPLPEREADTTITRGLTFGIRNPRQLTKDTP
jgi:putative DNA primase/helicase